MHLEWLELTGFRSYHHLRLEPEPGINVLVGANASGKTNVLEAMAYLARLRSFRGAADAALISDDADAAVLRAAISRADGESLIEIEMPRAGRRRVQVNRRRPSRLTELLGHLRVVVFLPDDLGIVKRGPAHRRSLLDELAVQLWPGAYGDLSDYDRALRQRNALLRQEGRDADKATLEVWNERLSEAGSRVMDRRARAAVAVMGEFAGSYRRLAGPTPEITLEYISAWGGSLNPDVPVAERSAQLWAALEAADKADRDRRVTTVGLHRDEPIFRIDGREARSKASQGEQRTLVLALRIASHRAITEAVSEPPLLLLDDVFSELDRDRAGALAGALPIAQTFVTTARHEEVPVSGKRWTVNEGRIE